MRRAAVALLLLAAGPGLADSPPQPLRGQDLALQARDTEACDKLAMGKSGFDPAKPVTGTVRKATGEAARKPVTDARPRPARQAIYDRERSACLVGRGYKVGG